MGQVRISWAELETLTGKSRMQLRWCLKMHCPYVEPERIGQSLFFSPAQAAAVAQALTKVRKPKAHTA